MISIKAFIFRYIMGIIAQSVHIMISRKEQRPEVVIALRYYNNISFLKNIFTPKNTLLRAESLWVFYNDILWNALAACQIFFHCAGFIIIRTFFAAYDYFFHFSVVVERCGGSHSLGEIWICLARLHFWGSSQHQCTTARRNFADFIKGAPIGNLKNPYIRPEYQKQPHFCKERKKAEYIFQLYQDLWFLR